MNLLKMMDNLLRDRRALYETAREGRDLHSICGKLLAVFVLTTCVYGAVMGAFRCIHSGYYFSDFELTEPGQDPIRGKVAGMTAEDRSVYTQTKLAPVTPEATVRFNITDPSEPYKVIEVGEEKGYYKIVLAPGPALTEVGTWRLLFIVAAKTPFLFILTLLVCALALYVLNLAFGMKLHFMPSITLMMFALAGTGVMLAVFAPIALLFTIVTESYHFMKMMHVLVFFIAGVFGVKILGEGLTSMRAQQTDVIQSAVGWGKTRLLLLAWLFLYCLVGAQLAWTLKPFLGTPYLPATPPFRIERGNIFVSTLESFRGIRGR